MVQLTLLILSLNVLKLIGLSDGLSWQEIVFVTVSGLRGGLSLVLAQAVAASQEGRVTETQQVCCWSCRW
jgi:NhaP-type Na+/H+ or K+/H+ antiporter